MSDYTAFLRSKATIAPSTGIDVPLTEISQVLKPHQRKIVQWAVAGGRRALFESFGLGKTIQQLEILRLILAHGPVNGRGLIVCPLGVHQEFEHDAGLLGITVHRIRTTEQALALPAGSIAITNYEPVRDGKLDPNVFTVASLDEAAILRSFGSKTYQGFLTLFEQVPYRFVATATPSPNRFKELIHYAAFLGIMDSGQALTRFFKRDSTQANNLTLLETQERNFWLWLASWSVWLQEPSEMCDCDCHASAGPDCAACECDAYRLPEITVEHHRIEVDHLAELNVDSWGQTVLLRDGAKSLQETAREKRRTLTDRVGYAIHLIAEQQAEDPGAQVILFCHLNDEQRAIERALTAAGVPWSSIDGAMSLEDQERDLRAWRAGETVALIGKPVMLGVGLNLQQCHREIFVGIDHKFHDTIQAVHRIHRFGQAHPCRVDLIYAESEQHIADNLTEKWSQHEELTATMRDLLSEHGLSGLSIEDALTRSLGVERMESSGDGWRLVRNDCIPETQSMGAGTVDLVVTSIPFNCYSADTEVLTDRGWLSFGDVRMSDTIGSVNPETGEFEWQTPTDIFWKHYDGDMLHFAGRSFDHLVTPNHKMFARRRDGDNDFRLVRADEIERDYRVKRTKCDEDARIGNGWHTCLVPPRRGGGALPERIEIPRLPADMRSGHGVELYWIETSDFMRLAGWYLAEGHADPFDRGRQGGRISLGQLPTANKTFYDEIEALFLRIGLPPSMHSRQITVWCRNLAWFLQVEFGHGSPHKRIPRWVKNLHPDLLTILRDTMMKGDGAKSLASYTSASSQLRDDFQEICLLTGWRAAVDGSKFVYVGSTQLFPEIRKAPKRVPYSGMIGCVTVPNHTLIVRRNGKAFVSGNTQYEYSAATEDLGFNDDVAAFWEQMDYLTPELLRILAPGRLYCCHVKDRIMFGNVTGAGLPTVLPFHAQAIDHSMRHGFDYLGMITVVTDVVRENNQTYRLGWSENAKDGTKMGVGSPEYVLLFHKPQTDRSRGYADAPVTHPKDEYTRARWQVDAHAFWRSSGDRLLSVDELSRMGPDLLASEFTRHSLAQVYSYEDHVTVGEALEARGKLPSSFMSLAPGSHDPMVWHDVNRMRTLNGEQKSRNLTLHLCPLQIDIVERLIRRFSNPGDLVLDPFSGLGTVPLCALRMDRRGIGVELNADYWRDSVAYLKEHEAKASVPTLFDAIDEASAAA